MFQFVGRQKSKNTMVDQIFHNLAGATSYIITCGKGKGRIGLAELHNYAKFRRTQIKLNFRECVLCRPRLCFHFNFPFSDVGPVIFQSGYQHNVYFIPFRTRLRTPQNKNKYGLSASHVCPRLRELYDYVTSCHDL